MQGLKGGGGSLEICVFREVRIGQADVFGCKLFAERGEDRSQFLPSNLILRTSSDRLPKNSGFGTSNSPGLHSVLA